MHASHGVDADLGVFCAIEPANIWFFAAPTVDPSPNPVTALLDDRSRCVSRRVHPPSSCLPFRVPSLVSRPVLSAGALPVAGSPPSSRRHRGSVHCSRGFHPPLCSALRLSQPLGGFLRSRFYGLVASRCHVQGFTVQGVLPLHSLAGSSPARAPVPLPSERSPANRLPPSEASTSRRCSV